MFIELKTLDGAIVVQSDLITDFSTTKDADGNITYFIALTTPPVNELRYLLGKATQEEVDEFTRRLGYAHIKS